MDNGYYVLVSKSDYLEDSIFHLRLLKRDTGHVYPQCQKENAL